jgi:hypothetical protein
MFKIKKYQVEEIRKSYANHENKRQVYKKYSDIVSLSGFNKIWQGVTWKNVMPEVFTQENKDFYVRRTVENNPNSKLTYDMIYDIQKKINQGVNLYLIYKDYENLFTKHYFISLQTNSKFTRMNLNLKKLGFGGCCYIYESHRITDNNMIW